MAYGLSLWNSDPAMSDPNARDAGTWVALISLIVVAVGLLGLVAMVAPHVLGIVLIVFAFVGFGALHYLVWGWWLGAALTKQPETESQSDEAANPARDSE